MTPGRDDTTRDRETIHEEADRAFQYRGLAEFESQPQFVGCTNTPQPPKIDTPHSGSKDRSSSRPPSLARLDIAEGEEYLHALGKRRRPIGTVDVEPRERIQETYREVLTEPDSFLHFHSGPVAAERARYEPAWHERVPESSLGSFAGVPKAFRSGFPTPSYRMTPLPRRRPGQVDSGHRREAGARR